IQETPIVCWFPAKLPNKKETFYLLITRRRTLSFLQLNSQREVRCLAYQRSYEGARVQKPAGCR
ncbi:hypothetical protein, partial [Enterococcus faecalis]|uniref:hypothetical protein n=1 Tax=Enterococcus faecalis TaxID=1351 RepID=UPI001F06C022